MAKPWEEREDPLADALQDHRIGAGGACSCGAHLGTSHPRAIALHVAEALREAGWGRVEKPQWVHVSDGTPMCEGAGPPSNGRVRPDCRECGAQVEVRVSRN